MSRKIGVWSFIVSTRFLIVMMGFYVSSVILMQRINLSTAIVCMLNNTGLDAFRQSEYQQKNYIFALNHTVKHSLKDECAFKVAVGKQKQSV